MSNVSSISLRDANNEFTKDVYQHLTANTPHNAIICPLGLHMVLGLTSLGAAGSTADAMMKGLHIKNSETLTKGYKDIMDQLNKSPELKIANTIYFAHDVQLNHKYQSQAEKYFKSELSKTDFTKPEAAAKQMNDWVTDHTNGKIKDIVQSETLTPDTKLVLINAIHFKGKWSTPFNSRNTKDGPFYLDETHSVQVIMMHISCRFFMYQETGDNGFQVLELPYDTMEKDKLFSMHIFLPNKRTGLSTLENKLFQSDESFVDKFAKIANAAKRWREIHVTLPRFKIESTWEMNDLCRQQLGMNVAFTDEADLSHMTQDKLPLKISKIVQKAFIEVNEEGTEAAAATGVMFMACSMPPPSIIFTADHPFIVTISSTSDRHILFIAKIANIQ